MTREELLTAAREAKASGQAWYSATGLADDANLPEPDALFISLCSPDAVLEMQAEIDKLRAAGQANRPPRDGTGGMTIDKGTGGNDV